MAKPRGNTAAEKNLYRVIDANLNRAREGLRVIEDTSRFVLSRDDASENARNLRHRLDFITRKVYRQLLTERDTASDPGRKNRETKHKNVSALLGANFRRVEEALRVLEEYGRIISPLASAAIKSIRFKIYKLEKELLA